MNTAGSPPRIGYAAVDVETTGFTAGRDAIAEIAIVTLDVHAEPIQAWHSLVNPGISIPPDATRVHGISDRHVAGAPSINALSGRLHRLLAGRVIVAHKAVFDCDFLDEELPLPQDSWLTHSICTLETVRQQPRTTRGTKLAQCCSQLGVQPPGAAAHTALGDALACAGVLRRLRPPADDQLRGAAGRSHPVPPAAPAAALPRPIAGVTGVDGQIGAWDLLDLTRLGPLPPPQWSSAPGHVPPAVHPARVNAGAAWTPDSEALLRTAWLAPGATLDADALLAQLSHQLGRSTGALTSRLLKLLCHPQQPGRTVTEGQARTLQYQLNAARQPARAPQYQPETGWESTMWL